MLPAAVYGGYVSAVALGIYLIQTSVMSLGRVVFIWRLLRVVLTFQTIIVIGREVVNSGSSDWLTPRQISRSKTSLLLQGVPFWGMGVGRPGWDVYVLSMLYKGWDVWRQPHVGTSTRNERQCLLYSVIFKETRTVRS